MTENQNESEKAAPSFFQNFVETNRERRGHDFIGPEILSAPDFYASEEIPTEQQMVVAHYFAANSEWWVVEVDKERGWIYCYACIGGFTDDAEWGYSDLSELEALNVDVNGTNIIVERDLDWTPVPFGSIKIGGGE